MSRTSKTAQHLAPIAALTAQITGDIRQGSLTAKSLGAAMTETFGGSDASGAWGWRMAYDVMQASAALALRQSVAEGQPIPTAPLARRLLTETRRSEAQMRLQQFSTPLPYAELAVAAAMLTSNDIVLEPSAGTGNLAIHAQIAGAQVQLNEVDPFRAQLLGILFGADVTQLDAEHIDDLLSCAVAPSVVLMNPPFSASVDRAADPDTAAKHLISAAKRLAPGGRLVAILPPRFTPARSRALWNRACEMLTPRMQVTLPGTVYRKLGTSVDTVLFIADKLSGQDDAPFVATAESLSEAHDVITRHCPPRLSAQKTPVQIATAPSRDITHRTTPAARPAPRANTALIPLDIHVLDTPHMNPRVSDINARYAPQRIEITGAQDHPTPLVESLAMASVLPPAPKHLDTAPITFPAKLIDTGTLSVAQLDAILMAWSAHEDDLPGRFVINDDATDAGRRDDDPAALPYRKGAYIGDGTGCGKGRELAGLILANWLAGRQRAIWVSKSADLIEDARRDWSDLGGAPTDIQSLSKWSGEKDIPLSRGVLFVTYATLRATSKSGRTRLDQILHWLGGRF